MMSEAIDADPLIVTSLAKSCVLPVPDVLPISRLTSTWGIQSSSGRSRPSLWKLMVKFPAVVAGALSDQVRASMRVDMEFVSVGRIVILPGLVRLTLPPNERIAPDTLRSPLFAVLFAS